MSEVENIEKRDDERIRTLIDGDRLVSFSDAVFAFAATLLVLKIDLPNLPPEVMETRFWGEIAKLLPAYTANFVSFIIIGYYWRTHHKIFIFIKRFDSTLIWLNLLVLISVAFLPFPIDLFGDYPQIRDVVVFYTLSISTVGFLLLALWLYASHNHRLIDKNLSKKMIRYQTISILIAPLVFALSIPLTYISHNFAKVSWVFIIVLLLIINKMYHKKIALKNEPE